MSARVRPIVAVVVALVTASPVRAAAPTCPNERAGADAADNLASCLDDARAARKAGEGRSAAQSYARAVAHARAAYEAGRAGAAPGWFVGVGEQIVYYGTEGCGLRLAGPPALEVLTACVDLLELYLGDLAANQAADSRSAKVTQARLAELRAQRDAVAPPASSEGPPPTPEPAAPPGPAVPSADDLRPTPTRARAQPRAPYGLQAGLGVSLAAAAGAVALLGVGGVRGRELAGALERSPAATDIPPGQPICEAGSTLPGCAELTGARGLYVAGGVALGLSLAAAAIVTGLLIRERGARAQALRRRVGPAIVRGGAAVTIGF